MPSDKSFVEGTINNIIFENSDFFKILNVNVKETNLPVTEYDIVVTGDFAEINPDLTYKFFGKLVDHPKYGKQLRAFNYEISGIDSDESLVRYLSGEKFTGIGKKTAEKIVKKLGSAALDEITDNPQALVGLGLSKNKQSEIKQVVSTNRANDEVIIQLNTAGFSAGIAAKIYRRFGAQTLDILHDNPYKLMFDIQGVGFLSVDKIAKKIGIPENDERRIEAAVYHEILEQTVRFGDTFIKVNSLLEAVFKQLKLENFTKDDLIKVLQKLELNDQVVYLVNDHIVFLKTMYDDELKIANKVAELNNVESTKYKLKAIKEAIKHVESENQFEFDETQRQAIISAINYNLMIVTGGPGTGKTTILNGIIKVFSMLEDINLTEFEKSDFPIQLAAPTGRAAKKMTESTGLNASTIHRLLGISGTVIDYSELNDVNPKLLIIDEMSMVDNQLFATLIGQISPQTKVIMVGDKDQLPSVGPGQVFADLIESKAIETSVLRVIHRQDENSSITEMAKMVNQGEVSDELFANFPDRSFLQTTPDQIEDAVAQVIAAAKRKGFNKQDIQVLSPLYRGVGGINELNDVTRKILNPEQTSEGKVKKSLTAKGATYRIGDKIIYLVNSPEKNVFNGEIGEVVGINLKNAINKLDNDELILDFDGNEVRLPTADFFNINLAFCTSVHKAQGSEFKVIILPMLNRYSIMLSRQILYTAITRAKDFLILLGEKSAVRQAIDHSDDDRQTYLKQQIFSRMGITPEELDFHLKDRLIDSFEIDPMIGMDGIYPSSFK